MTERKSDDRAAAIAEGILDSFNIEGPTLAFAFAAALRAYGRELVNDKLDEAARRVSAKMSDFDPDMAEWAARIILFLKAKPEAQGTQT